MIFLKFNNKNIPWCNCKRETTSNLRPNFLFQAAGIAAEWLAHELQSGLRAGADPKLVPNSEWDTIGRTLTMPGKSIILIPTVNNLIDLMWPDDERPEEIPSATAYVVGETYAGEFTLYLYS